MPNFPIGDTQKVQYSLIVTDADGNPDALGTGDTLTVASSDTASLTVVPDASPLAGTVASGFLVGGTKVQTGVTVTATLTPGDGSAVITAADLIDVVPGKATALAFSLGSPIPQ